MKAPRRKFKFKCPNAHTPPGGGFVYVEPGNLVVYEEYYGYEEGPGCDSRSRLGRVLDSPYYDAADKLLPKDLGPWLRVLTPTEDLHFGYIRYVAIGDVRHARPLPSPFANFFFSPELPPTEIILAMDAYGSLNDAYLTADLARRLAAKKGE